MPSVDPDDMVGDITIITIMHRLKYKLITGPVFPNLSTSSLGDALNLETFRKIFKMVDGRYYSIVTAFVGDWDDMLCRC